MKLNDIAVRDAKPEAKQRKLFDGGGLYILIHPNGSKYWQLAYRFAGKQKTLALGIYPDVTLAAARDRHEQARKQITNGIDPSAVKQAQKSEQKAHSIATGKPAFQLSLKGDALTIKIKTTTLVLTTEQTEAVRAFLIATPSEVTL